MKSLSFGLIVIAYLLLSPVEGFACSCMPPLEVLGNPEKHVEYERQRAAAVFAGRIVEITEVKTDEGKPAGLIEAKFEVEKSWKGATTDTVVVSTTTICCICGYPFKVGQRYLVYALGSNLDELSTTICTRTIRLKHAAEDIKFLGEPIMRKELKRKPARSKRTKPNNGMHPTPLHGASHES